MRPSKRTISTVSLQLNRRSGTNPLAWRRMTLQLVALPQAPRWALSPGPRSDHCRDMWEQVRLLAPVPVWSQVALLGREMLVPLAARSKHDMTPFMRSAWPPKATVLRDLGFIRRPITKVPDTINIAEWRRPAHRPFRGLLGVHSRYGLHTRAVTVFRDTLSEGFSHFVASMTAPVASGWSGYRVRLAPTGKRRLFTAHANNRFTQHSK
jgi:hypothetical protein